jgi:hypothetical protein
MEYMRSGTAMTTPRNANSNAKANTTARDDVWVGFLEYTVASPPQQHAAARASHGKSFSSMSLLLNDGLRRIGILASNDDGDGEEEEKMTETRSLMPHAHVKSSSHLTGLFDPLDATGTSGTGRPVKATLVHSFTFMGLRGLGGPYPSSSGMTTTTTGRNDGMANTLFEPVLYRIRSQRRRMGVTHNRYQSMIYAHEMLGITGSRDKKDGGEYPMMHRRDGSGSSSDALPEGSIRRQSVGSADDIGKIVE